LSETFPQGDKGGNISQIRIAGGSVVKLHPMFDGLLGKSTSLSSIKKAIAEVEIAERDNAETIGRELNEHMTPTEWSAEGFALAVKYAYLDGDLRPAYSENKLSDADTPSVAEVDAENAGRIARVQVAKAGKRLAKTLGQSLRLSAD
jgi:hypothetical protein